MALGRVGSCVALLFAFAGAAVAQPYPSIGFGGGSVPSGSQPISVPSPMPGSESVSDSSSKGRPAFMPPGTSVSLPSTSSPNIPTSADGPPLKELPTGDLIPPPHHGGHHLGEACGEHEISGYLRPFVPGHSGWYFSGEFLLMRPRNSDFDYVISSSDPGLSTIGPIASVKYDTGTGFRVEGGRRFGETGKWEAGFAYTYFTSSDESGPIAAGAGALYPTLTRPGLTDRVLTATADADLDYSLYDFLIGRRFVADENFAVRIIGGGRFADIRQNLNAFYDGGDARQAAVVTRSRFQGFGPLIGGEAVLVGWKGFHLYTRAFGGLIAGRSTNRVVETNDAGATVYTNVTYDVRKVVPMGSIAIGAGWQYRTISIRGGFEVTHWQGVFERPRFVDDVSQGKVITRPSNLTLEGLFLQVGLSF